MSATALLALHYQNEVLHQDGKIRLGIAAQSRGRAALLAAARNLLEGARDASMPVVHVRIAFAPGHAGVVQNAPIFRNVVALGAMEEGSWGAEFHAGLEPTPGEAIVTHHRVNGFFDSALDATLRTLGATRLLLAGVATNSVVEHTGRHAADLGYEIVTVADACAAARADLHRAALDNLALLGEVTTVARLFAGRRPA